jgi:hypothetical protein
MHILANQLRLSGNAAATSDILRNFSTLYRTVLWLTVVMKHCKTIQVPLVTVQSDTDLHFS